MDFVTRFAPSPTGALHLGHAYSALQAFEAAAKVGGRFRLRIEDIDQTRCRPEFVTGIFEDLAWLGLTWEGPVRQQSRHFSDYETALETLKARGLVYPCFCTRKDIAAEIAAADAAPHGPDGPLYPGTCRSLSEDEQQSKRARGEQYAWRLDSQRALEGVPDSLHWRDEGRGWQKARAERFGDVVLARKDCPTSYHLAVVHDDALEGISHIVRGDDLFDHTYIHVLLQHLLGYGTPVYRHHRLIRGADGKRLAKRDKAETLRAMRERGVTASEVKDHLRRLIAQFG